LAHDDPPKGDFTSVPLNVEGRNVGNAWDAAKDERRRAMQGLWRGRSDAHADTCPHRLGGRADIAASNRCGAANTAVPFRRIESWSAFLAGRFTGIVAEAGAVAGFAPPYDGPSPGKGERFKVVTTHMKPGYLRRNGVPYSGDAVLTEFFDRVDVEGTPFLILTTVVEDPKYLTEPFITSEQFKWERDGSKWDPNAMPINSQCRGRFACAYFAAS